VAKPVRATKAKCVVPNLRGLTVAQANAKLAKAGCELGRTRYTVTRRVRAGRVVRQNHKTRARLRAASRIDIVVARRPRS
jgi:beta-lactam-binding protein with PASTA domain